MANYWTAFDWGSYERKTAHLKMVEDGAYRRLLAHYYTTGRPLPANTDTLMRVCRAFSEEERAAVLAVLSEFFTLESDGYHNKRADEEIVKAASIVQAKSKGGQARASMLAPERRAEIAKNAAEARWKTKDLQNPVLASMPAECLQDALQSQLQLHKEYKPQRKGTRLDSSFQVTEEHRQFARQHNLVSPDAEIDRFRDYWIAQPGAKGVKLDWDATFRNWLRNSRNTPSQPSLAVPQVESLAERLRRKDAEARKIN